MLRELAKRFAVASPGPAGGFWQYDGRRQTHRTAAQLPLASFLLLTLLVVTVVFASIFGPERPIFNDADLEQWAKRSQSDPNPSLYVQDSVASDAGLAYLAQVPALKNLGLYNTGDTDAGSIHLKSLKQLEFSSLNRSQVTDKGLIHLKDQPHLECLDLCGTKVTDEGLIHLQALSQLHTVNLSGTQVTYEGVAQLGKALPRCRVLHLR